MQTHLFCFICLLFQNYARLDNSGASTLTVLAKLLQCFAADGWVTGSASSLWEAYLSNSRRFSGEDVWVAPFTMDRTGACL